MKNYLKEFAESIITTPEIGELRQNISLDREKLTEGLFSCLYHLSTMDQKKITGFEGIAYEKTTSKLDAALSGGLAAGLVESNAVFFIIDYIEVSQEDSINPQVLTSDHNAMGEVYDYFGVPRDFSDELVHVINTIQQGSTDYSPILNFISKRTGKELEYSLFLFGRVFGGDIGDALEEQVNQQADEN